MVRRALLALLLGGCEAVPQQPLVDVELTAISLNAANPDADAARALGAAIAAVDADFVALQECEDCDKLTAAAGEHYRLAAAPADGVVVLYDSSRWSVAGGGVRELGIDDDGWGRRVFVHQRMRHRETSGVIFVYSTHFCVPIRSEEDACDTARQLEYADFLLDHIEGRLEGAPVLLGGDFNVFDGFSAGPVVARMLERGLQDLYDELDPGGEPDTFEGNDWAPAGRIDYLFGGTGVSAKSAQVQSLGFASDHHAVIVALAADMGAL